MTDSYSGVFFADNSEPILIVNVLKLTNHAHLSYTFCQKRRQLSHKKKSASWPANGPCITPRCVLGEHGVFKGLSRATKWCTPKNYIFWNLLCMLVNVGGAKEIRKFGQHLQPGHYYALLFVPRYKYAQMYCNIYNGPILTFKTPKSTNLGSRNWFLVSQYC